jgi:hypothetical protein
VFFGPTRRAYRDAGKAETTSFDSPPRANCDEKACTRPLCLHQAMASWSGAETSTRLDETPAACPLRAIPSEQLIGATVHENPRHQA